MKTKRFSLTDRINNKMVDMCIGKTWALIGINYTKKIEWYQDHQTNDIVVNYT